MSTPHQKTWRDRVPGCFGVADLKFARNVFEAARAEKMIRQARKSGASSEEIESAIRDYLVSREVRQDHIDEEMGYAKRVVA